MIPTTREAFAQFILRRLGAPVIQINLSEEQVDDIIDQALYFYGQYHMDGNEKTYYTYALQQTDINNKYIVLPPEIIGAVRIFPLGQAISSDALFNMRYQFIMQDLYSLTNVSLVPYFMTMTHISLLEEVLVGQQPIRYNRHNNLLYLDMDMSIVTPGEYIVVEAYMVVDPGTYPDVWRDKWLQDYCTALMEKQWGQNLKKYNTVLPSGITLNGQKIFEDAKAQVERMEHELITQYSLPSAVFMA